MNQMSSKKAADIYQTSEHKKSLKDKTYPQYHLRAPSGWVNDPCGLFYFNSSFHVFMQSNPWGKNWGDMSWSHVVSAPNNKDKFKWFYPVSDNSFKTTVLIPSLDDRAADRNGIFTGCIKNMPYRDSNDCINYYPTAFYSAVWGSGESTQETVCIARALDANKVDDNSKLVDPHLTNWTKYSSNNNEDVPHVVLHQPEELNLVSFRDPFIFNLPDDDNYYMLMSAGRIDENNNPKGVALCFKNEGHDITQGWERANSGNKFFFEGNVCVKDTVTRGGNFECVVMYRLTDHIGAMNNTPYILIFAQDGSADDDYGRSLYYILGDIIKTQSSIHFEPLEYFKNNDGSAIYRLLDLSPDFIYYAANIMPIDSEKRNILMAWLNIESANPEGSNWTGALAIPRFLFVYKYYDNRWMLGQETALIDSLKNNVTLQETYSHSDQREYLVEKVIGRKYNAKVTFQGDKLCTKEFGFRVIATDSSDININITNGYLSVDDRYSCKLDIDDAIDELCLDVYLDGSSLEIFMSKKISNGSIVGFATYSSQLKTLYTEVDEKVFVYANKEIISNIKIYNMQSCWISAPEES